MQTITLLVAIADASSSSNSSISSQVPKSLHESKTLVLCPPSLVDNWVEELLRWSPGSILGRIDKVDTTMSATSRFDAISDWSRDGGVLVVGYSLFRTIAGDKREKQKDPERYQTASKQLLEGANIVVLDEAHYLKNPNSDLAKATHQLRTKSRIALTGSPLANNLTEYFELINLVAPGTLSSQSKTHDLLT